MTELDKQVLEILQKNKWNYVSPNFLSSIRFTLEFDEFCNCLTNAVITLRGTTERHRLCTSNLEVATEIYKAEVEKVEHEKMQKLLRTFKF